MKSSDRAILFGLVILGLGAAFWFLMLAPKRERAGELADRVTALEAEVAQQEQLAAVAEQAKDDYARNYQRLILLGKAAPADGDTPSLLIQLSALAERSGTEFGSLAAGGADAPPPPPAAQTTTDQNTAAGVPTSDASAGLAAPALATEASAALLPLGATVGPAGLGVMPYTLQFTGGFFQVADLLRRLDTQVAAGRRGADVAGRLTTVNSFSMAPDAEGGLAVELTISTFVLPSSQGLTAGATPSEPPPAIPAPTPVSNATPPTP